MSLLWQKANDCSSSSLTPRTLFSRRYLALFLLSLPLGLAQVRLDEGATQLLGCFVGESLPEAPDTAEQGGYKIQYQAFRGATDDDRACSVYSVRNTPGKPPTPVRWLRGSEVFIEELRLARCAESEAECDWVQVAKYFDGVTAKDVSEIAYGLNADSFHEVVDTFATALLPDEARGFNTVGTEIQGTFAGADGSSIPLHLLVKSVISTNDGGNHSAIFEITDNGSPRGFEGLYLRWGALNASKTASAYLQDLPEGGRGLLLSAEAQENAGEATLERSENRFAIVTPIGDYTLRRDFRLEVFHQDAGPRPLIVVTMPAFLPKS